ncbi:helix-turn-helix domain-containing protein [Yinghuangia sp. ASG 101]|uniref:helix-turn-helix domain-containing protein n=1 Tax=Yinghuangia sp. ASG 101 TaxID=2896848 RepID=UPI001E31F455|nr:helix-turn-helix transcriptional regulator [Yinghuangia sp. ASG 101]UGQ13186.1 helix-turn-helix domain-containing protein [Yinghuangia sp. ASG 101]
MSADSTHHVGARIARFRKQRDLLQQGLAMRANVSKSLLSKVEAGHRPASPALIAACARALGVTTSDLLGQPYTDELRRDRLDALIQPIRVGMENWDVPHDDHPRPRRIGEITADVRLLLTQRREADYMPMARDLPGVIDELVHAIHTTSGEDQRQAYESIAGAFRCVFTLAWNFGYLDLATVALDRIALAAPHADEPGLTAMHAYLRAQTVLSSGRYDVGLRVVDRALRDLGGQDARRPEGVLALQGSLHLRAAVLAGRAKDVDAAKARLTEARTLASATGELADYGLTWGPPNVGVHAVAIACELDQWDEAIRFARDVRIPQGWSRSRAAHHWMDLGRAQLWAGHAAESLRSLERARRVAPQQTRYHPTVRETVLALKRRERVRSGALSEYARWVGV